MRVGAVRAPRRAPAVPRPGCARRVQDWPVPSQLIADLRGAGHLADAWDSALHAAEKGLFG
eukprot:4098197-Pyramimonas_sp.AAC.1